jgi:oligopeptide transport system substrate-binding protein
MVLTKSVRRVLRVLLLILLIGACAGLGWTWLGHRSSLLPALVRANRSKTLLFHAGSEPRTLDPQLNQGVPEGKILNCLFEGLVINDPSDNTKQLPGAAEKWEHNDDLTEWTFHLRKNGRWSNGDPLTAQDFVFSFKRELTPEVAAPFSDFLFVLKGAEAFFKGKTRDFSTVGVKALDAYTLQLELSGPTPYLLSSLTNYFWYPVHQATLLRFGGISDRTSKWTLPGNMVNNGPFILKTWRKNDVIEVVKNPYYYDQAAVKLNGVNFYSIEDLNTVDRAFQAGQLHLTNEVALPDVPLYRREHPDLIRIDPAYIAYFYRFNVSQKPFDNPKVRMALNLAIDREALVNNLLRAKQKPATGLTPPGLASYPALDLIHYDPEKARQLLAEAGYPNGAGFPSSLNILINTSESHRQIAEAIQQMFRQELNISVGIENQEWKVYIDSMNRTNFSIIRGGWASGIADPVGFLQIWTTGNPNNCTNWSNPAYDKLINQAAATADPTQRLALLRQAETILLQEGPLLPIYWYTRTYLLDPSVQNWHPVLLDSHPPKLLDLEAPQTGMMR